MNGELDSAGYEHLVTDDLRRNLMSSQVKKGSIEIDAVILDDTHSPHMIQITFRDKSRPQCLFGWRFPAADDTFYEGESNQVRGHEQALIWAQSIILTNFVEELESSDLGLPSDCNLDSVNWIGAYSP